MSEERPRQSLVQVIRSATHLVWKSARRDFILMTATQIVSALALAAELYLAREVLTEITDEGGLDSFDVLGPLLIMLAVVRLVLAGVSILRSELRLVVYERVHRAAAHELLNVAVAVDLAEYDAADFHDRLTRAYDNITSRIWDSVWSIVEIASAAATLVTLLAVLVLVAPLVLAFALVAALPMWWARRRNNLALYRLSYDYTAEDRERLYLEGLLIDRDAAGELRSTDLGPRLLGRIDHLFVRRIERMRVLVRQRLRWSVGAVAISNFMAMGAVALLAHLIIEGTISVADGGVALLALQQAAYRISTVSASVASLSGAALFLDDYEDFVRQPLPPQTIDTVHPEDFTGVRFENVTFTYPGTKDPVLRGVHLEIRRGELVALVGANGSGKSTIAKLIAGLYEVDDGAVVWDTRQGPVVDRHRIRPAIGLVFQRSLRFELSAEDNVGFGDSRCGDMADRDRVWAALQAAGIAAVIESSGVGLDVRLGRTFADGVELSAGQWQRVGIARAFYRDAPLLVLDEPTAAVDARAEEELFRVVRRLQQGRGVVLITHRMATVRAADRIYVMSEGQVIEHGSHHELMAEHGHYADLYDIQARAYRDPR